jgi:DNA-binding SARP family transcriptional activator
VEFRILGPLEVRQDGRTLPLGGPRQRALLALLLTSANDVVSSDRLIDELWGTSPPTTPTNALQYHVSQLRKALSPSDPIVTREPGYLIRVGPDELDLLRFERLLTEARDATPEVAADRLREALGLWRGRALSDLAGEAFAQREILRLEELHLGAVEQRIEADLALGRHTDLVGELEALARENPLRERLRAQLMRALYASGRQVEALDVYRTTRAMLVDELGIEPTPALQELQQAILRQDPALLPGGAQPQRRAIIALINDEQRLGVLLGIAEALARQPERELILARQLDDPAELAGANTRLAAERTALAERGVSARVAVYTTAEPGSDAAVLAREQDVDLVLMDAPAGLLESGRLDDELAEILANVPCDVGLLVGSGGAEAGPVVTPFGGIEHDWSAIEVAAWLAGSLDTTLRLVGTEAAPATGRRDASRLLSRASLLVQQVVGIVTEPVLVPAGEEGVLGAARDARLLVVGLSERWQTEGLGDVRLAVAARAGVPTIFVRRGLRPSGIAPDNTLTRFTWTLASSGR